MQKSFAILHAHNTFNNGSFMMLINFIWYYAKLSAAEDEISFRIELEGKDNLERLYKALPKEFFTDKKIQIHPLPLQITSADDSFFLKKLIRLYAKLFRHPKVLRKMGIQSIIILGGDDISEYYKKWMILSDLYRIYRYSKFFPTCLLGQTIGPFSGIRKYFAGKWLSKTVIYTRDTLTTNYLYEELGLSSGSIHESADLCFPDLPQQKLFEGILSDNKLIPNTYLTIVPGGYFSLYTHDRELYLNAWILLIEKLMREDSISEIKIVLLPHVTRPEDDRRIIHQIASHFKQSEKYSQRIITIMDELLPQQLRNVLGNGYFTISSRMHAALSTFQMRKPAIALGYSVKYPGVIGTSVGCPELVVPSSAELISQVEIFTEEVIKRVRYTTENYKLLRNHLDERIPKLQELSIGQIRSLMKLGKL